jgi:hypothetical protein
MTEKPPLPSLVGYCPEEAERAAAELGCRVVWIDATPPRWLSPTHGPRVGRQRLLPDGALELLRIQVPAPALDE